MNLKGLWTLIKDTFAQWNADNPFQLAAALAYYKLFFPWSLVTLLLWVYYSSLMFFFGAELTQVYATRYRFESDLRGKCSKPEAGE